MAAEFCVGTRVQITRGDHKGKIGVVTIQDRHPVVVCDDSGIVLFGVTTDNAKKL